MNSKSSRGQLTLNIVGVIALVLGLSIASIVLVVGAGRAKTTAGAPGEWQDNSLSIEDSKAAAHDLEMYNGKMGMLAVKLSDAFHQPESLAMIIAAGSTLIALGCFFVARRLPPPAPPMGTKDFS
jgi:hypothetical protein